MLGLNYTATAIVYNSLQRCPALCDTIGPRFRLHKAAGD